MEGKNFSRGLGNQVTGVGRTVLMDRKELRKLELIRALNSV